MMGENDRSRSNGWRRKMGNARTLLGNMTGGLRGGSNAVSWAVAASLAYYLWVRPSQDLKRQQQERIAAAAQSASSTASSQSQPQETGPENRDSNTTTTNS